MLLDFRVCTHKEGSDKKLEQGHENGGQPVKYLSLFSGVGGFELAIHSVFPDAVCIGYSEVDSNAIKTYQKHFPEHVNLGDITKIDIDARPRK